MDDYLTMAMAFSFDDENGDEKSREDSEEGRSDGYDMLADEVHDESNPA